MQSSEEAIQTRISSKNHNEKGDLLQQTHDTWICGDIRVERTRKKHLAIGFGNEWLCPDV